MYIFQDTPNLTELYLGNNNLGYDGAKLLAKELGKRWFGDLLCEAVERQSSAWKKNCLEDLL